MSDKKNIKKITKINNKKSLNTRIMIKSGKNNNKNIVYVNNKPVDIRKKLFDLLILLINKNKRKSVVKEVEEVKKNIIENTEEVKEVKENICIERIEKN